MKLYLIRADATTPILMNRKKTIQRSGSLRIKDKPYL